MSCYPVHFRLSARHHLIIPLLPPCDVNPPLALPDSRRAQKLLLLPIVGPLVALCLDTVVKKKRRGRPVDNLNEAAYPTAFYLTCFPIRPLRQMWMLQVLPRGSLVDWLILIVLKRTGELARWYSMKGTAGFFPSCFFAVLLDYLSQAQVRFNIMFPRARDTRVRVSSRGRGKFPRKSS